MSSVKISPTLLPLGSVRDAAKKNKASEFLETLLGNKTVAAHLGLYLEYVDESDGYTAMLCAVKKGDLASARLLGEAKAKMFIPSTGQSALHILLDSPNEPMLNRVLHYGASPYIPNGSGDTPMDVILELRRVTVGLSRTSDTLSLSVQKFIIAQNAYYGLLHVLVKPSGLGWLSRKPVWKQRKCAVVPKCDMQGAVIETQLLVFSSDFSRLKDKLIITESQSKEVQVPHAEGDKPGSSVGLVLAQAQTGKPDNCYAIGCAELGWTIVIGMPSTNGQHWRQCPELAGLVANVARKPAVLFAESSIPTLPAPLSSSPVTAAPVSHTSDPQTMPQLTVPHPVASAHSPGPTASCSPSMAATQAAATATSYATAGVPCHPDVLAMPTAVTCSIKHAPQSPPIPARCQRAPTQGQTAPMQGQAAPAIAYPDWKPVGNLPINAASFHHGSSAVTKPQLGAANSSNSSSSKRLIAAFVPDMMSHRSANFCQPSASSSGPDAASTVSLSPVTLRTASASQADVATAATPSSASWNHYSTPNPGTDAAHTVSSSPVTLSTASASQADVASATSLPSAVWNHYPVPKPATDAAQVVPQSRCGAWVPTHSNCQSGTAASLQAYTAAGTQSSTNLGPTAPPWPWPQPSGSGISHPQDIPSLQEITNLQGPLTSSTFAVGSYQSGSNTADTAKNWTAPAAPVMVTETVDFQLPAHLLCLQHDWQLLHSQCKSLDIDIRLANQVMRNFNVEEIPCCYRYAESVHGSVTMLGPKATMQQAKGLLHAACDKAEQTSSEQVLPLEPHRAALFTHTDLKQQGKLMIQGICRDHRVVCHLHEGAQQSTMFNGIDVQVIEGNLCEQHASAIVNPTNEQLAPKGRVSQCIAEAVGPFWLQRSCKDLLKSKCPGQQALKLGTAEVTCCNGHGLRTDFEYIIHALGPHYSNELQDGPVLASTVKAVLEQARHHGMQSIAIPLIGAGQAGWPTKLAAKIHVEQVLKFASMPGSVKEIRFVDRNTASIAALKEAVAPHQHACSLSFLGKPDHCVAAIQQMESQIAKCLVSKKLRLSSYLSPQKRSALLQERMLELVSPELTGDQLSITCHKDLYFQASDYIQQCNEEALDQEVDKKRSLPDDWAPMVAKTQLFEVPLRDPAVHGLVNAIQSTGAEVVKVHRIQNQLLWSIYASNLEAMRARWQQDLPDPNWVNGGLSTLWHGTSLTDPFGIYAAEQGFQHNHASNALWGTGTYYSTRPKLAMSYAHTLTEKDKGIANKLHTFVGLTGLKQILAVDVLVGKAKELAQDTALKMPPLLEDERVGMRLEIANLRYDSVSGVHNTDKTPIYITYNSGHAYPKYLVTYKQ